jgi:hypothetical protein
MDEDDLDFGEAVEAAWMEFRQRLSGRLAMMTGHDVFGLEVEVGAESGELSGASPYLQFAAWGEGMIRAEAVSNGYLDQRYRLTPDRESRLVELGWQAPTCAEPEEPDEGSANFWVDLPTAEAGRLATMAVGALREVYGCAHPSFLGAEDDPLAARTDFTQDDDPEPTVPADSDELAVLVDRTLASMFEEPLGRDPEGDVPIVAGASVLFVRIARDKPAVDLYCELVLGVRDRARAAVELDLLNGSHEIARFRLRDDVVVMEHRLLAWPFAASQLRLAIGLMLHGLDDTARALATRLGGHRFAEPAPPLSRLAPDLAVDRDDDHPGMVALLELLHQDPPTLRMVSALFGGDVELIAGQLSRVRCGAQRLDGHDQDLVVGVLRRALRVAALELADARDRGKSSGARATRVSRQLSLLPEAQPGFEVVDPRAFGL